MAAISLSFCPDCGHLFNSEYDSSLVAYRPGYENSLRGSDRFREYDDALVTELIERYQLRGCSILEIGCGRGDFLNALCARGGNSGVGFDPSYRSEETGPDDDTDIIIRAEAFGSQNEELSPDFICSRHTLEHMGNPRDFLSSVRNSTTRLGVPVFIEVPNGLYTLRDGGIWDIIYEHCSYFTPSSLGRVFCETGYAPVSITEEFGGQFLTIHTLTADSRNGIGFRPQKDIDRLVGSFTDMYHRTLKNWTGRLRMFEKDGRKTVLWGAGAKGTTFLNLLQPPNIHYVIDVNPRKQGKFVVGTGQLIVPPEFLREYPADIIVYMNPNYREEIAHQVKAMRSEASLVSA